MRERALPLASRVLRPLLASASALLIALPARAEPPHDAATLTYLPSPRTVALCPDADFLAFEVKLRLRYELFQPSAPNHLTVKVERASNGSFRATGEMRDEGGNINFTREYEEIDCTAAMVAMALGVAIKFTKPPQDPEPSPPAPLPPASSPPVVLPASCPPAPKAAAPEPPKPPAPAPAERPRLQTGLAAAFSMGAAPVVVGGAAGFVGLRWRTFSLAVEGTLQLAPSATIESYTTPAGYHYLVGSVAASGCYHTGWAFGCVRTDLGVLAVGNSEVQVTPSNIISFGVGLRFGGEWVLTPGFALRAYSDFLLRPLPGVLREDTGIAVVWPGSVVSGTVGFGPVFTF